MHHDLEFLGLYLTSSPAQSPAPADHSFTRGAQPKLVDSFKRELRDDYPERISQTGRVMYFCGIYPNSRTRHRDVTNWLLLRCQSAKAVSSHKRP